jgi:hypothetical protein
MKNGKKLLLLALVIVLVASTVLAFTGPGKWVRVEKGQDVTVDAGRAGATFTDSFYSGTVNVYRKNTDYGWKAPKNFKFADKKILGVKFYDDEWNRIQVVTGAVYVYFQITPKMAKAWQDGRLNIYYWDTWKGDWRLCPTFALDSGSKAGCRIRYFGEYALLFRDP